LILCILVSPAIVWLLLKFYKQKEPEKAVPAQFDNHFEKEEEVEEK